MKVALTGSGGFIGRHVLAELERRGCNVIRVRRPGQASDEPCSVAVDLANPKPGMYRQMGSPDVLVHLAWGGLPHYGSLHHFDFELPLHYHWLKCLVEDGLPHVVCTGTCFEYGLQSGALDESIHARPTTAYGFAKDTLRCELEFLQGQRTFALTWTRLFYTFGEGQSEQSLLPQLRGAVQRGDASFPMSSGEQLRDYLAVPEVARMLVDLALTGRGHGVVNLCSGRPISVRSLVEGWIAANRWTIRLDLGRFPYAPHEPMAFWGDDTKLRDCLGRA